ncbi:hypothetical protein PVAP13_5NG469400 [Panicum virgatum]|uniref:Uncharacterized protein n=1 Tax=Panicum virgatum TaxID=38727 RepID=A0A8T0S6T9_PANVG|nr:hypothetical protein PVAP13_5NG469400 [Panicum virgatum]
MSAIWTRPVDACSLDDTWRTDCDMESFRMDVKSNPDFQLLQKFQDNEGKPFKRLIICQPTLSLHSDDHTVCFMVKINHYDHKAWVIAVDMKNNNLQGVDEFTAGRYTAVGFAYLHSRISKYLKRANHP